MLTGGVRSIEDGSLMDVNTLESFLQHDANCVPTLVTRSAPAEHGRGYGLPEASHAKAFGVLNAGLYALEWAATTVGAWLVCRADHL